MPALERTTVRQCQTSGCPREGQKWTVELEVVQEGLLGSPRLRCEGCLNEPAILVVRQPCPACGSMTDDHDAVSHRIYEEGR